MPQGDDEHPCALFAAVTNDSRHGLSFEKIHPIIRSLQRQHDVGIQFLSPDGIFGEEHLVMAFEKAEQNVKQGVNIADDLLLETLRIASGKRQIKDALVFLGVGDNSKRFLVLLCKKPRENRPENSEDSLRNIFQRLCCELNLREEQALIPEAFIKAHQYQAKVTGNVEFEALKKKVIEQMAMIDL